MLDHRVEHGAVEAAARRVDDHGVGVRDPGCVVGGDAREHHGAGSSPSSSPRRPSGDSSFSATERARPSRPRPIAPLPA